MSGLISLTLRIWRQAGPGEPGGFEVFGLDAVSTDLSLLEALDLLNERLIAAGDRPVGFEHDCREGICGSCGFLVNGQAQGPQRATSVCQLYLRQFRDGATLTLEPFRARAFPVLQDLAVDRSAFDRIIASGGYCSINTGSAPEANALLIGREQAAQAFGDRAAIGDAVSHYRRRLHPGTAIVFCCTIEHAEQMAGAFRAAGIRAASVSGGTPTEERKRLIGGLATGEVEVLSSCMIISEGTDIPSVGGAILMRPTASLSLYLQMVGRALRPAPRKQEAVILDHVGNAHRHGLPTDEREWNLAGCRRREGLSIPIKDCKLCRVLSTD